MHNGSGYWDCDNYISQSACNLHSADETAPISNNVIEFTFFISCYNEESFIIDTLNETIKAMDIINKSYEIIIIDDCSSDQSTALVRQFIENHPHINIMLRVNKKNKGLGQNYIDGAFIGRGKYYRLICGDNAEPAETLVTVLSCAGQADIIAPYHLDVRGKSLFRKKLSKLYTWVINKISGNSIKYYNGLHLHLRQNVMRWHANTRGFAFQASLLCQLLEKGFTCKEVPCIAYDRRIEEANALTWKNVRSVAHVVASMFLRRIVQK